MKVLRKQYLLAGLLALFLVRSTGATDNVSVDNTWSMQADTSAPVPDLVLLHWNSGSPGGGVVPVTRDTVLYSDGTGRDMRFFPNAWTTYLEGKVDAASFDAGEQFPSSKEMALYFNTSVSPLKRPPDIEIEGSMPHLKFTFIYKKKIKTLVCSPDDLPPALAKLKKRLTDLRQRGKADSKPNNIYLVMKPLTRPEVLAMEERKKRGSPFWARRNISAPYPTLSKPVLENLPSLRKAIKKPFSFIPIPPKEWLAMGNVIDHSVLGEKVGIYPYIDNAMVHFEFYKNEHDGSMPEIPMEEMQ